MKHIYNILMYACVGLLLASCADSSDGGGNTVLPTEEMAVSFSTAVGESAILSQTQGQLQTQQQTQTQPLTRATTGLIPTTDSLKATPEGFGVFAYLTDATPFNTTNFKDKDNATTSAFSNFFMQNQQVTWGVQYVENGDDDNLTNDIIHRDWVYAPLKYWPNSTDNAASRYISFFAYAPYVAEAGATAGVTNFTRSDDRTPHVIYQIGAADEQVDLLWANCIDATRNGDGLITIGRNAEDTEDSLYFQKVPLTFHHALSAIDIYVQRVYDEPAFTGKIPSVVLYPTLFVNKLELTSSAPASGYNALQTSGKLSLIDGTWENDGTWTEATETKLTYEATMFNDTISGTTSTSEEYIRDAELDKWKWILDTTNDEWIDATTITDEELTANPTRYKSAYGVSEEERMLLKNAMTQVLIPGKVTLIPTLTYSMVSRDNALELNYLTDSDGNRYNRILNEVEGNSVTLDLVAGKRYTLLIRIGVEHVSFELVSVVDWDFPMRFRPTIVTDFEEESKEHILNGQ